MESGILSLENPIECRIVRRVNRFVVEVQRHGKNYRACINNTGRLHEFLVSGRTGFCLGRKPGGKTDYRLFAIEERNLGAIIDTQLQMQAFEKSLEMGLIPWLEGYRILRRNARLGNSLIDYLLEGDQEKVYLEVKSAVLRQQHYAMYPDCPSARGRRHIRELTNYLRTGGKASILFIAGLPEVKAFKPNRSADPELCELLIAARQVGVEIRAIGLFYNPEDSFIHLFQPNLEIALS